MPLKSLNQFHDFRNLLIRGRNLWLRLRRGVTAPTDASISLSAQFAAGKRGHITLGDQTLVAFHTYFYTRDPLTGETRPIRVGSRCFIGGGSVIGPGVTIGDECIVAAGAVVLDDVPDRAIAAGNPARIIRREIEVGPYGRLKGADDNSRRMYTD
ncbi:MAG: acyltransferase [Phenylobacterium sp.]|uniref:acyltransferase n=1 Tax=Phenylobacterium sp. TaxID=1871053 RepID=UPI0025D4E646|nr:acyltransferase [Phenylobacterium sp.]MBI1198435.1 acyltransferase [Phenylobacterium sp.]